MYIDTATNIVAAAMIAIFIVFGIAPLYGFVLIGFANFTGSSWSRYAV